MSRNLHASLAKTAAAAVLVAGVGMASMAQAAVILSFAQTPNTPTVTATNNAADTTTAITGTAIPILISQYAGAGAPINAFLNLNLMSTSTASTVADNQILQPFSGMATFTGAANGGGTDYLSINFTDFVFGTAAGSSLTLSASEPPGTVTFTSDVLPSNLLGDPRALGFGFASVTQPAAIVGTTLRGFTSSVAGTVSAAVAETQTAVPEPATLALLGAGLVGLGAARRRRAQPA